MSDHRIEYQDASAPPTARGLELLWKLFRSGRPISSILAGSLAGFTIWYSPAGSWSAVAIAIFALTSVTMGGFIVNDIFDLQKDRLASVQRPIAKGEVHLGVAQAYAFMLFGIAVGLVVVGSQSIPATFLITATMVALLAYSPFAQRWPLFKGVYTAALCCIPFIYGIVVAGGQWKWYACPLLFLCIYGRELYMDALESEGDHRAGLTTLAIRLGRTRAILIAEMIMAVGLGLLILVSLPALSSVPAVLSFMFLGYVLRNTAFDEEQRVSFSRVAMLLASITVASFAS